MVKIINFMLCAFQHTHTKVILKNKHTVPAGCSYWGGVKGAEGWGGGGGVLRVGENLPGS